jgi:hypothetical protein
VYRLYQNNHQRTSSGYSAKEAGMLGAICNKVDYAAAVALVSVFIVLAWIAYALCFVT